MINRRENDFKNSESPVIEFIALEKAPLVIVKNLAGEIIVYDLIRAVPLGRLSLNLSNEKEIHDKHELEIDAALDKAGDNKSKIEADSIFFSGNYLDILYRKPVQLRNENELLPSANLLNIMTTGSGNVCIPIVSESSLKSWIFESIKKRVHKVYPPTEDIIPNKEEDDEGSSLENPNPNPSFNMKIGIYHILDLMKSLIPALQSVPFDLDTEPRVFSLFEKMTGEERRKTSLAVDDYFDIIMSNDHPWSQKSKDFGSRKSKNRSLISPNGSVSTSYKRAPSVSFRSSTGIGGSNSSAGSKLRSGPDLTKENLQLALGGTMGGENCGTVQDIGIFNIFESDKKIVSNGIKLKTPLNFRDMPLSACMPQTVTKSTLSMDPSMSMSARSFHSSMDSEQQVKNVLHDVNRKLNKVKK